MIQRALITILLSVLALGVQAGSAARVETLQTPVWVERHQQLSVLDLGDRLHDGDIVVTGAGARAILRLADGSTVKLGENVRFQVESLQAPEEEGGVLSGVMNVLKGAFRFTTGLLGARYRRDLKVGVNTATIGIRGTDVWGKAAEDRDFVVLIEGNIDIERNGDSVNLSDANTLYMAPKGEPAKPLAPVDMNDLARWAEETEPQSGAGVRSVDGKWRLLLASYREHDKALDLQQELARQGTDVGTLQVTVNGQIWFRLLIDGYVSRTDAEAAGAQLGERFGFSSPWVTKLN